MFDFSGADGFPWMAAQGDPREQPPIHVVNTGERPYFPAPNYRYDVSPDEPLFIYFYTHRRVCELRSFRAWNSRVQLRRFAF